MNIHHYFIPHISNNFRAKLLHHQILVSVIITLFLGSFLLSFVSKNFPSVLGQAIDISSEKLISLTNEKRIENGVSALRFNEELSKAADLKASDMLSKNYWAHNSPDGKTPWVFIKTSGYTYVYAGENLARGFSSAEDVVNAWMASATHRSNLLSETYEDIGLAVKKGKLNGEETVLIVQMFGSTSFAGVEKPSIAISSPSSTSNLTLAKSEVKSRPLINSRFLSSSISQGLVILFISVLLLDMIIVQRKNIIRFVGHNVDHVFFLILILMVLTVLARGIVL